jgi:hypothetical protein
VTVLYKILARFIVVTKYGKTILAVTVILLLAPSAVAGLVSRHSLL